jgi:hypothetical protein
VLSFGERRVREFKCASIRVNIWVALNWKTNVMRPWRREDRVGTRHSFPVQSIAPMLHPFIFLRVAFALLLLTCCFEIHSFLPSLLLSRILSLSSIPLLSKNTHFIPSTASSLPSQLQALRTFIESFFPSQSSSDCVGLTIRRRSAPSHASSQNTCGFESWERENPEWGFYIPSPRSRLC